MQGRPPSVCFYGTSGPRLEADRPRRGRRHCGGPLAGDASAVEQRRTRPCPDPGAIQAALESNKDLRKLQSQVAAKGLEMRSEKAARLPRVDLVAQYGLFAKFNHYEDYFRKFQRNNGQIGVSFQVPLFTGPGVGAQTSQTQTEISHLKVDWAREPHQRHLNNRSRVKAETAADVGPWGSARATLRELVPDAGGPLSVRWKKRASSKQQMDRHSAQYVVEKAKWNVLRTGDLVALSEALP